MTIINENQRDWVHVVSDYYSGGSLNDHLMNKAIFKEHEMVNLIRGILSAITYCHFNLRIIIGNLNPEGIVCDFKSKAYHTRIVNFNHTLPGPYKYVTARIHKLNLDRITDCHDDSRVSPSGLFLAPEQALYGLAYNVNQELEKVQKNDQKRHSMKQKQPSMAFRGAFMNQLDLKFPVGLPQTKETD